MRIHGLTADSADITFERKDRGTFKGRIEGPGVVADANAFLLAAWLPAWAFGEARIRVDGSVCPILLANLQVAASVLKGWYCDMPALPRIECETEIRKPSGGRAAFLSGGVDSLSMLRGLSVDAAVLVDYQHIVGVAPEETEARFRRRSALCRLICSDIGAEFWPLRTNLRGLNESMNFWMYRYHGAFLAGMAHSLDIQEINIASTKDAWNLSRWGSHPQLDPHYSSNRLTVCHRGIHQSRLDKVRVLSDWPLALEVMNVCTSSQSKGKNCGKCEKCIRTRLELLVLGKTAGAFRETDVTLDDIALITITNAWRSYEELLDPLRRMGREDLANAIEAKKPKRQARSGAP